MSASVCTIPFEIAPFRLTGAVYGALLNHRSALTELGGKAAQPPYNAPPRAPVLYIKPRNTLAASGDAVEIPAGLCDPGEDGATTVRREIQEEMGLRTDLLEKIGDFLLTPGGSDERCALFAGRVRAPQAGADGIAGNGGLASEHEDIRSRVWPAERALEEAVAGRFPNSVTTIALLWLAASRAGLRARWSTA